ncbi:TPA: VENN motif pre-toxin domain-containing protein, partial [Escherichia coli]|nr:Contact-dependent inhibitor A [Escherichia coli]EEZ7270641.1 Contact-dependent inhibitor A [Escherichia coli O6]EFH8217076.1 Contact-dependent inhibitor A [Escherichia coli]EFN7817763.1 Contact-dependent inhibitor A [Escherichia coli]EFO5666284.1 Contact-dependent inhibitor A [Escherichia coli]
GGFDITVGRHTQLDGAVIASTATPDKNHLDTGTLGFSDLHNEADYKVSHSGISLSGGGSFGDKFQGNMPGGMISAGGHSGHAEGTTQAAVAEGTITIRDRDNQKQNLANLSRDPAHANDSISPIFDKEKEQRRLQTVGLISDIGSQVADIARTQGELNALKAAQDKYGPVPADATEEQRQAYLAKLRDTPEYKKEQEKYGTGSDMQRGIQAATAALQGLVGGNMAGALAGASAPELANIIGHHAGIDDNTAAKAIAHAILGGVTAALQGNSAAAGAIGAGTGEVIASAIAKSLYPGVDPSKLTEDQKQTVSTLATLSAGMAGGIASGDVAGAAAGAGAGKNVVENNALSLVARGCAVAAPCRTKVAEQLLEIGAKAGMAGLAGAAVKDMADRMTSDELEHLITLQMMGNDEITTKYLSSLHDKYGSGAASNPNIGKDLTDAEKVELGGSGSGTGTPPPSENDPKQQNEKTVDKLNQKQESAIKKIDNTIKNALKDHDIIGTLKDMDGKPVPKENGGYWDHMQEMQNTLRGLRNHADTLKNVNNPEAQAAYGRATDAINKIESALKGYGI